MNKPHAEWTFERINTLALELPVVVRDAWRSYAHWLKWDSSRPVDAVSADIMQRHAACIADK